MKPYFVYIAYWTDYKDQFILLKKTKFVMIYKKRTPSINMNNNNYVLCYILPMFYQE